MIGPMMFRPAEAQEPERTNLVRDTAAVKPPWTDSGSTSTNLALGLMGGYFNGQQVDSGGAVFHRTQATTIALTSGTLYQVSFWYDAGTSGRVRLVVRGITSGNETRLSGAIGSLGILTETAGTITNLLDRVCHPSGMRCASFGFTPAGTESYQPGIGPDSTTIGENVIAFGCQIEQGAFPTSLIKTSGSAASRYS